MNRELQASGNWVFAGGLHPPSTATVVRVTGGDTLMTDGPFTEERSIWAVLDHPGTRPRRRTRWGRRLAKATTLPVEVRPFQGDGSA